MQICAADATALSTDAGDPIAAAWESIRAGLRRDCGARTFDGWLQPDRARRFRRATPARSTRHAQPVHGRLGADPFRRAAGARLAARCCRSSARSGSASAADGAQAAAAADPRGNSGGAGQPPASAIRRRPISSRATGSRISSSARPMRSPATPPGRSRPPTRSPSTRCSSMAAPGAARPTCCTPSATTFHRAAGRAPRSSTCRPRSSWSSSSRALRANDTIEFKQQLRSADLLMIDDVQFIAGKEFDPGRILPHDERDHLAGRRLVISSDRAPQDLDGIAPRILSRLSAGAWSPTSTPADLELRLNIIDARS